MLVTDGTTFINGFGLGFALLMGLLMLFLPRRHALLPAIALICFETMGQRVMIAGLNFTMIRLLVLFGIVRVVARGEAKLGGTTPVDRALLWYILSAIVTYTLLWQTKDAFVNRLGMAYDAIGLFFLFRLLMRDLDDMRTTVRHFARCVIILAACMLLEKSTGRNTFAALGGVEPITVVRDGVLRCQGPFAHPILAGVFGSALVPLFLGLRAQRQHDNLLVTAGLVSAITVVICAGSSGPLLATGIGIFAWFLYGLRHRMQLVRRLLLATVILLHICMKAPVWFLLARMTVFDGSTGWHRSILIDHAIEHFPDWWLIGTHGTANWGFYMFDVTDTYVAQAVEGGLFTLLLFILIISRGFASAGDAIKRWGETHPAEQRFAWALGCALLVHIVNYISVVYFDQNIVCWYLLLAMLATCRTIPAESLPGHVTVADEVLEAAPKRGRRRDGGTGPRGREGERDRDRGRDRERSPRPLNAPSGARPSTSLRTVR